MARGSEVPNKASSSGNLSTSRCKSRAQRLESAFNTWFPMLDQPRVILKAPSAQLDRASQRTFTTARAVGQITWPSFCSSKAMMERSRKASPKGSGFKPADIWLVARPYWPPVGSQGLDNVAPGATPSQCPQLVPGPTWQTEASA